MLRVYGRTRHIQWRWRAADSRRVPAPLGGELSGPNPTDRSKQGVKIHLLVDQHGAPLAMVLTGANRHDATQLLVLVDGQLMAGPAYHLCADKAYDSATLRANLHARGSTPHIRFRRPRNTPAEVPHRAPGEPVYPARRWVVERTFAWLAKPRSLRTCWAKTIDTWAAFVMLACCHILARMTFFG